MEDMKLIVLDNIKEVGEEVDKYLQEFNYSNRSYIMDITRDRFNNGEAKIRIEESIRDKDVFILSDVGNYSITYKMHGMDVPMGPDEHFQDIKRCISALAGYARRTTIITPLLYQSRQDKRKGRESLDCAIGLQELERLGINHIVSFDVHNKAVANAVPNIPFENFYPTNIILEDLVSKENINNIIVIGPDSGAMERARYYADMLNCNVGVFSKRRDLTKLVDGKNPIVEHVYLGADVKDKTCIVVDDMIASGSSMIEVGERLREMGSSNIFFVSTFSLFTAGIECFEKAYKDKIFDKLYTTNLTYIPSEYKTKEWLEVVNCSKRIAEIIDHIHKGASLRNIVHNNEKVLKLLKEKR